MEIVMEKLRVIWPDPWRLMRWQRASIHVTITTTTTTFIRTVRQPYFSVTHRCHFDITYTLRQPYFSVTHRCHFDITFTLRQPYFSVTHRCHFDITYALRADTECFAKYLTYMIQESEIKWKCKVHSNMKHDKEIETLRKKSQISSLR
jgi:hypothetical protein